MKMKNEIHLFTIGFTQKSAEIFFELLLKNNIKRVIDTRLNNVSQLAGFSKKQDLAYFLKTIGGIEYEHNLDLAPTGDMLNAYKKKEITWDGYEQEFKSLIKKRKIETKLTPDLLQESCFLCSEAKPHHCHRRIVAEYLSDKFTEVKIVHL